jgi:hypothetical protein
MSWRPWKVHFVGLLTSIALAVLLLLTLIPYLARVLFTPPLRGYNSLRFELLYYLVVALLPVALWLVPAFVRLLGRAAYNAHKTFFGRTGFYLRYPTPTPRRFRTTLVMSVGPFAIDILAIVEIEHFFGNLNTRAVTTRSFYVAPILLVLAGIITALIPAAWIINELGIRHLNPETGEVSRASAIFDGLLGPASAAALLVSFITTLSGANYSYEEAIFALAVWAIRLYPPVLAAVSIYRIVIEPRVLPSLQLWCDQANIPIKNDLPRTLEAMRPNP